MKPFLIRFLPAADGNIVFIDEEVFQAFEI